MHQFLFMPTFFSFDSTTKTCFQVKIYPFIKKASYINHHSLYICIIKEIWYRLKPSEMTKVHFWWKQAIWMVDDLRLSRRRLQRPWPIFGHKWSKVQTRFEFLKSITKARKSIALVVLLLYHFGHGSRVTNQTLHTNPYQWEYMYIKKYTVNV